MRYRPTLAQLRKSFQLRTAEFLRENSLHGFNYFVDPERPMWERVFWFICTLASFSGALASITIILMKFTTQPMLTVLSIKNVDFSANFPHVVVCQTSEYLDLSSFTEEERTLLTQLYDWNWRPVTIPESFRKPIMRSLYRRALSTQDGNFVNCSLTHQDTLISPPKMNCLELLTPQWTEAGSCYVGPKLQITSQSDSWNLEFGQTKHKTLNLYLSSSRFIARGTPISYRLSEKVSLPISLEITTTQNNAYIINPQLRGCALEDESISYMQCQSDCHVRAFKKFNCTPWWIENDDLVYCTPSQYNQAIVARDETMKCWSECYMGCETTWYRIDNVMSSDITSVSVSGLPLVIYKRKIIYGLLDLVVVFGGIMGLFLGYSLFFTVEFIYYFTLRPYCGTVVPRNRGNVISITVQPRLPTPRKPLDSFIYRNYLN